MGELLKNLITGVWRRASGAFLVLGLLALVMASGTGAAHAQGGATGNSAPSGWAGAINGTSMPTGANTTNLYTFGSTVAQDNVGTDYGMVANTFLARFTPVLVLCSIAGAVMIAAKSGVKLLHGWLRSAFGH